MMIFTMLLALAATPAASTDPIILDFTADWCGPCQQMKPAIDRLSKGGYPIKPVEFVAGKGLAHRYNVTRIPTFLVVDGDGRELGRLEGYRPAGDIASLYDKARARPAVEGLPEGEAADNAPPAAPAEAEEPAPRKAPLPWQTVVRIKITDTINHTIEFGSGTIIASSPEESIILTCAHIFKVNGVRQQFPPSKFPMKIEVHLFDGILRDRQNPVVHMKRAVAGQAIDYDFVGDVGLIRIRPGEKLEASPVVGPDWKPERGLQMTTVGCSQGHDATAWSTRITDPKVGGVAGYPSYEGIECQFPPKQGRSGGGLYTLDGRLAGVCDFAEPTGGHGLYATPRTIYKMLDRNRLSFCYNSEAPRPQGGALLASRTPTERPRADSIRLQNAPEPSPRPKKLTIPPPERFNIPAVVADDDDEPTGRDELAPPRRNARLAKREAIASNDEEPAPTPTPIQAEMSMSPRVEGRDSSVDLTPPASRPEPSREAPRAKTARMWTPVK